MSRNRSWWTFGFAMVAYALLVLILGLPVLIADCGAGAVDVQAACAAAARASTIYKCTAVAVLAYAAWVQWRAYRRAVAVLLCGAVLPIVLTLISNALIP